MRTILLAFAAAMLLSAPAAAAPTCQDRDGTTIRCGTAGAMPVGWTLSPEEFRARQNDKPGTRDITAPLKAIGIIALLLTLIALLPDFDGSRSRDWLKEGDDDGRD